MIFPQPNFGSSFLFLAGESQSPKSPPPPLINKACSAVCGCCAHTWGAYRALCARCAKTPPWRGALVGCPGRFGNSCCAHSWEDPLVGRGGLLEGGLVLCPAFAVYKCAPVSQQRPVLVPSGGRGGGAGCDKGRQQRGSLGCCCEAQALQLKRGLSAFLRSGAALRLHRTASATAPKCTSMTGTTPAASVSAEIARTSGRCTRWSTRGRGRGPCGTWAAEPARPSSCRRAGPPRPSPPAPVGAVMSSVR